MAEILTLFVIHVINTNLIYLYLLNKEKNIQRIASNQDKELASCLEPSFYRL